VADGEVELACAPDDDGLTVRCVTAEVAGLVRAVTFQIVLTTKTAHRANLVDVPTRLLFSPEVETGSYGLDREEIFFNCMNEIPRLFRDTDHVISKLFGVAIFKQPIPARWIKTCWSAKRPEFLTKKQR